ncbi:MAG: twin-arginine translocase TatA/TatE family subunit [Chloroflexi bacterium]|nr:twin-arginine translocase TatA/TatE family subunit [Chloroflexota bacterium]
MNVTLAMLNGWEIVLILAVVLVLFGAKKLPELARGLGQGIREFKKSSREITDELQTAMDMEAPPVQAQPRKLPAETPVKPPEPVAQSSPEIKA